MPISGRTWSQLFLCAVACAAQIHVFQATRHSAAPSPIIRSSMLRRAEWIGAVRTGIETGFILALTKLPGN